MRTPVAAVTLAAVLALAGCGGDSSPKPAAATKSPTAAPASAPAFQIVKDGEGLVVAEVETGRGLRQVFDAVRQRPRRAGAYRVWIVCTTGSTAKGENRLVNGAYQVGADGAQERVEYTPVPGARCPAGSPPPSSRPTAVPSPTAAQQAAYLAALRRIHPGLVVNRERALRRAGRVCERIVRPPSGGTLTLEKYTAMELSGGNATINETQARQVIRAVKVWCR